MKRAATLQDVLIDARTRIAVSNQWTTFASARDAAGRPSNWKGSKAICWCMHGSLQRSCHELRFDFSDAKYAVLAVIEEVHGPYVSMAEVNDRKGLAAALEALDRTAAKAV